MGTSQGPGSKSSDRSFGKMFLEAKKESVLNSWLVKLRTLPLTKPSPPPPEIRVSKPALSGETNGGTLVGRVG